MNASLAVLRGRAKMNPRQLWSADALRRGDTEAAWQLLSDIRAEYARHVRPPPAPTRRGGVDGGSSVAGSSAASVASGGARQGGGGGGGGSASVDSGRGARGHAGSRGGGASIGGPAPRDGSVEGEGGSLDGGGGEVAGAPRARVLAQASPPRSPPRMARPPAVRAGDTAALAPLTEQQVRRSAVCVRVEGEACVLSARASPPRAQKCDTRSWLHVLAVAPAGAALEGGHLLDNPLYNGTLLCALARLLEPRWRVRLRPRPRALSDARANFEAALDVFRAAPVAGRRVPAECVCRTRVVVCGKWDGEPAGGSPVWDTG